MKSTYVLENAKYRHYKYLGTQIVVTFTMPDNSVRSILIDSDIMNNLLDHVEEGFDTFDIEYDDNYESEDNYLYRMAYKCRNHQGLEGSGFIRGGIGKLFKDFSKKYDEYSKAHTTPPGKIPELN